MSPKSLLVEILLAGFLAAGCAPAATPQAAAPTEPSTPAALAPLIFASPGSQADQTTPTEVITATAAPFLLDLTPVPTDTPLSTVEIPTEVRHPPALQVWDGLPTYPADSNPNYYFRLSFDPSAWALTTDNYGFPALVHRAISNCTLSPAAGRGLPPNATVEQEMRRINGISYQINAASVNGVKQTVTYTAGDGRILTAFQLSLEERPDQCIQEAETVLGTLSSVPVSQATPIATP